MRLFYQNSQEGKTLYVVFVPNDIPDKVTKVGNVVKLEKGGALVGYNLFNIELDETMGMVVNPKEASLAKVNEELSKAGFAPLDAPKDSLYHVVKVVKKEEHPLDERSSILTLDDGGKTLSTVTRYQNISEGDKIVVALDLCQKFDGTLFNKKVVRNIPIEAEVCSPADLRLGEESRAAYIENNLQEGQDFFIK